MTSTRTPRIVRHKNGQVSLGRRKIGSIHPNRRLDRTTPFSVEIRSHEDGDLLGYAVSERKAAEALAAIDQGEPVDPRWTRSYYR